MFKDRELTTKLHNVGVTNAMQRNMIARHFGDEQGNLPDIYARLASNTNPASNAKLKGLRNSIQAKRAEAAGEKEKWLNEQLREWGGLQYHLQPGHISKREKLSGNYNKVKKLQKEKYNELVKLQNEIRKIPKNRTYWTQEQRNFLRKIGLSTEHDKASLFELLGTHANATPLGENPNNQQTIADQRKGPLGIRIPSLFKGKSNRNVAMHLYRLEHTQVNA